MKIARGVSALCGTHAARNRFEFRSRVVRYACWNPGSPIGLSPGAGQRGAWSRERPRMHRMKRGLLVAIAAVVLGLLLYPAFEAGGSKSSGTEFFCGFSATPGDCGFSEQAKAPGRATLVKIARAGGRGVRLRTEPGDHDVAGSGSAERNDLALSEAATGCREGAEQWWAHSVLFPDDYVAPPQSSPGGAWHWGVVFSFHHSGSKGQANFHVDAMPDPIGLRLRGYGGERVDA